MKERWGDLVSSTCLAGIRRATSHSEKNSITRSSRSARTPFTVLKAFCISGVCTAVCGSPGRWTYSSAKKSLPIFDTHWLAVSRLMVILARGHGSGKVDKQCNSSDVSCGGTAGSSCGWDRYLSDSSSQAPCQFPCVSWGGLYLTEMAWKEPWDLPQLQQCRAWRDHSWGLHWQRLGFR